MSDNASKSSGLSAGAAGRYARAVFDIAQDAGALGDVEKDLATLAAALKTSADLREFLHAPLYRRSEQAAAIHTLSAKMNLSKTIEHTLALMAQRRRLSAVPAFINALNAMIAAQKGEQTVEVTTAHALTDAQTKALTETLKKTLKKITKNPAKSIKLNITTDESLIGGLVIKQGSVMIDSSIKSKLANFHNAMKEL